MSSNRSRQTKNDELYFRSYDQFQVHELMLRDRPRVSAYYDAIMNNKDLFQDKVVLDVGSGTGILSMFAARAGARKVYAVDACPTICDLAKELIRCNHLDERIQVINKRVEEIDKFDPPVEIIISEWMGFYLFHESMLESVIYARDHFLSIDQQQEDAKESIFMFPSHAYVYCAPFIDQRIRIESNSMWKNYFDLNLSPILSQIPNSNLTECVIETIEPSQLIQEAQLIRSIDLRTVQIDDLRLMNCSCEFQIDNTCIISGFAFWFDCYFPNMIESSDNRVLCLSTSPFNPATHWKQTLVFLNEDIYPLKGDNVNVNIRFEQSSENRRQYNLTIALGDVQDESNVDSNSETGRKRQRKRSSESEKSEENDKSEDESEDEHPIPCDCDFPRCKLIKALMEKYDDDEDENVEDK